MAEGSMIKIKVQFSKEENETLENLGLEVNSDSWYWKTCWLNPSKIAWVSPYELDGVKLSKIHFTAMDGDIIKTNIPFNEIESIYEKSISNHRG